MEGDWKIYEFSSNYLTAELLLSIIQNLQMNPSIILHVMF